MDFYFSELLKPGHVMANYWCGVRPSFDFESTRLTKRFSGRVATGSNYLLVPFLINWSDTQKQAIALFRNYGAKQSSIVAHCPAIR